ncbi:MAG: pyridoxal-phosphate dependent enzyme [Dehalococcoidia bacterium]|nr:pyridoxal-phosphate dependent enzyme [Dehalococcoidia bacterium]
MHNPQREGTMPLALFEKHPVLGEKLPHISLADLPTPVERLGALGARVGVERLYVKRDDLTGPVYGGNKPRKLEFLLAEALRTGKSHVLTFGCAGSNHALATAIYSRQAGLKSISMLMDQPNARYVRQNLLASHHFGAELHLCNVGLESRLRWLKIHWSTGCQVVRHTVADGKRPMLIPPGGTSITGVVGYVNAAFELARQVAAGQMPEPDLVYVASGTMGTAAGLILGLPAAGLKSHVVAVEVVGRTDTCRRRMASLVNRTAAYLHSLDDTFPAVDLHDSHVDIRTGYLGDGYACFTKEGMEAVSLMMKLGGIGLEGTYTGKTLAALVGDVRGGAVKDRTLLFWNTVNSRDLSEFALAVDYHDLPHPFHRYFEEDVQPLDHGGFR